MTESRQLLNLVERVYDAALDPSAWPAFLSAYAGASGSVTAGFSYGGPNGCGGSAWVNVDPAFLRDYNAYYGSINAYNASVRRLVENLGRRTPVVWIGQSLLADDALEKTEYYADFLRPHDLFHLCGAFLVREGLRISAALSSYRPRRAGPFDRNAIRLAELLTPHVRRAIRIEEKLHGIRRENQAMLEAFDQLQSGVILLDARGRVVLVNRAAGQLLAARDGLTLDRGELRAATSSETLRLRQLVRGAAATGAGRGVASGGAVRLPRPSLKTPLSVLVSPLPSRGAAPGPERPAVVVFVEDPDRTELSCGALLSRMYGLTPAEASLAARLVEGRSVSEAAEEQEISILTARTQLKQVYSKTGVGRQADLVRLALQGPARLRIG